MYDQTSSDSPSVLIVDDAPENLVLLQHLLGKEGYDVRVAPGGRLALQSVQVSPPDLILLDVRMPDIDGFEVCRRLKAEDLTRDIPVIFLTALDSAESEGRGLELGALDYIAKPFNPHVVRARVRNHVRYVRQRKLLEKWALVDALTEIPNRRRLVDALEQEWGRALRARHCLSLAMLDLDRFKQYNDGHGHLVGDQALCSVAKLLNAHLHRSGDLVARYGGEEFVMLFPDTTPRGARRLAEGARAAVERLGLRQSAGTAQGFLTVSVGGASLVPLRTLPPSELLERADRALYRAKGEGRNRVVWDGSGSECGPETDWSADEGDAA
jgi:diguanylate cyclase (GGDEF)-like protein